MEGQVREGQDKTSQVRTHHGRRGGNGAEAQGLLELQGCQSVEALRICKAVVLMYIACAGSRVGEFHDNLWEDVRQVNYDGQMICAFSYLKEKQDETPEKVDSMLGDEVSNMVFNLYAGIIIFITCCLLYLCI